LCFIARYDTVDEGGRMTAKKKNSLAPKAAALSKDENRFFADISATWVFT
jgi:hypothetical protein